jgi:N4-gp56 family major capsid protein
MAETRFLTNNELTRKKWAKELYRILLPATEINDLVGTGPNAIIEQRNELAKGAGDQITFGITLPLSGEGIVGNDKIEGNEERLTFRNFKTTIEELNHAVETGGKMEEQRVPYDLMKIAKDGLQYWWADILSDAAFAHLCGDTTFRIAGKTFAQNPVNPDTEHVIYAGAATSDATVTSSDIMTLSMLDKMKQKAELPTVSECYKLRPLMINGKKYFRVILHNYCFDQLRRDTNVGQWGDLLRSANKLQMPNVEIEYNGMLISKSERIRHTYVNATDSSAGTFRNIMLGAQAAVMAWGGAGDSKGTTMAFHPYTADADRFMNVRGGGIWGIEKTRFSDRDYGIIVGSAFGQKLDD